MSPFLIPIVGTISSLVVLPIIIVTAILGGRYLRLREKELALREKELEIERERLETLKLLKADQLLEKAGELSR